MHHQNHGIHSWNPTPPMHDHISHFGGNRTAESCRRDKWSEAGPAEENRFPHLAHVMVPLMEMVGFCSSHSDLLGHAPCVFQSAPRTLEDKKGLEIIYPLGKLIIEAMLYAEMKLSSGKAKSGLTVQQEEGSHEPNIFICNVLWERVPEPRRSSNRLH